MYIVTATFEIDAEHLEAFRTRMLQQAADSLEKESGCRHFDVCFGEDLANLCFLYEKYDDRAAFDQHLASQHFQQFVADIQPWVVNKQVNTWIDAR